jgi:anaerobic selenocysteine-containing dehydrogenase
MKFDRRDVLKVIGGTAAGALLTPVPWKLLDDTAIWTQNWSWVPRPLKGELRVKHTTCTLCPAGCAVRARCVGDQPFALVGAAGDALCPAGLCAHQLAYVPQRPAGAVPDVKPEPPAAILDLRPGRTASLAYRAIAARMDALYVTPPQAEGATLSAVSRLTGQSVGFDLARVKTLVSIGTPVLEGWGTPSRILRRKAGGMRVVQIERRQSRTAMMADEWIPSERVPADLPQRLEGGGPALVIADGDPASGPMRSQMVEMAAALSLRFGGEAIVPRREAPHPPELGELAPASALAGLPDRSIQTLFVDETSAIAPLPWRLIERKLRPGGRVVAMTASPHGTARHADAIVPSPAFLECADDAAVVTDSPVATFRVSTPLLPAREDTVPPVEFLARLAGVGWKIAELLEQRAGAIQQDGRGEIVIYGSGEKKPAKGEELWKLIADGAAWMDEAAPARKWTAPEIGTVDSEPEGDPRYPLALVAHGYRGDITSPMLRKLDQESDLRPAFGEARIHPATASRYGIGDGRQAYVETACGSCRLRVRVDSAVAPGTVEAACGPNLADVCDVAPDGTWSNSRARIQQA